MKKKIFGTRWNASLPGFWFVRGDDLPASITMAGEIDLFADVVNGGLVLGLNSAESFVFKNLYQGAVVPLRIFPVSPRNTFSAPLFDQVDPTGFNLLCSVGPRAGTTALLASCDVWTKQILPDSGGKKFYFAGNLNLNTVEMNAAIGALETIPAYFELQWSGGPGPFCQVPVVISASVRDPSGAVVLPTVALSYPDWLSARAAFLSIDQANAVEGFYLRSAGGTSVYCYVTDDGALRSSIVTA